MKSARTALLGATALSACVVILCVSTWIAFPQEEEEPQQVELASAIDTWFLPLATIKPTNDIYIYWGGSIDKYASAKVVRSNIRLNHAPEYITSFEGQRFRGLSLDCCNVMVFPPFAHGFPVHSPHGSITRRIRRFVAEGNTAIFTGGITDLLFLNQYFQLHLEPVDGVYAAGPFIRRYDQIPNALKMLPLPSKLNQVNVQATAVSRQSLPYGSVILYDDMQDGAPVFMLRYCMVNNPKKGEPPFKVNPASCDRWAKKGNPCSCGNLAYIGFNYRDQNEKEWNILLEKLVEFAMHPNTPTSTTKKDAAKKQQSRIKHRSQRNERKLAKKSVAIPQKKISRKTDLAEKSKLDRDWEVIVHQGAVNVGKKSSVIEIKEKK